MKLITAAIMISFSFSVFADDLEKPFDQVKERRLENIDKHISILSEHKTCISSSTDRKSMKECDKIRRTKREALRAENKRVKSEKKTERESKRKERKP